MGIGIPQSRLRESLHFHLRSEVKTIKTLTFLRRRPGNNIKQTGGLNCEI